MIEHTPEPWEYFEEIHEAGKLRIYCSVARKAGGKSPEDNILRISGEGAEHTVRRIVACVNACAGIETETLEAEGSIAKIIKAKRAEIAKLRAERGAVLNLADLWDSLPGRESFAPTFAEELRAALAEKV